MSIAAPLIGAFALGLASVAQSSSPTVADVVAALPPIEGMRLSAFQAQAINETDRRLFPLNPNRIVDVQALVNRHILCFRQIALEQAEAKYEKIAAQLTSDERAAVITYLQDPDTLPLLYWSEGTVSRVEGTVESVRALAGSPVDRFLSMVHAEFRRRPDVSAFTLPCHREFRAEGEALQIRFVRG